MTQTLTTERQQFEQWWHEEYCHLEGSSEAAFVKHVAWEAMKKARELLANREAQPVTSVIPDIGSTVVNDAAWKLHDTLTEHGPLNGHQFNNLKGCLYEVLKIVMNAPPAPAVPEEMTGSIAMTQYRIKPSNYKQWVKGYNACRAAMLAAVPEGGN